MVGNNPPLKDGFARCGICDVVMPSKQWGEHIETDSHKRMAGEYTHLYSFDKEDK